MSGGTKGPEIPAEVHKGDADVPVRLVAMAVAERSAVLATVDPSGAPYTSLVSFAYIAEMGAIAFATPRRSVKYRNIKAEPRVSVMMDTRPGKSGRSALMKAEAVTVQGKARPLRKGRVRAVAAAALIARCPELADFVEAATTAIVLIEIESAVHVSGFQHVTVWKRGEG